MCHSTSRRYHSSFAESIFLAQKYRRSGGNIERHCAILAVTPFYVINIIHGTALVVLANRKVVVKSFTILLNSRLYHLRYPAVYTKLYQLAVLAANTLL